jgi:integrase/recombinase XerD
MSTHLPLIQAMEQYIEYCQLEEQSQRTIEGKRCNLRFFVRWYLVHVGFNVSDLTRKGVLAFIKFLHGYRDPQTKRLICKRTRRNKITAVRMLCLYLYQNEYLKDNLADKVKTPKADKTITQVILQSDEVVAIANQTAYHGDKGLRDNAILAALFACGFRRGDVTKLKINGINKEALLLFVPDGKGGQDRIVPIAKEALDAVLYYKDKIRPKFVNFMSGDYLFLDNRGLPYNGGQITALVNKYKRRAGVSKPGASNLYRHTTATTLLDNGADLLTTQKILGHASVVTTQGYTHIAVKKMSEDYQKFHPAVSNPNLYMPRSHPAYISPKPN